MTTVFTDTIDVQPTPTPEPTIKPEHPIIIRYTNDINGDYDRNQSTYSGEQHATKTDALWAICGNGIHNEDHVRLAIQVADQDLDLTDLDDYDQQHVQQILNLPIETKTGWVIIDDRYTDAVAANKFNSLNDLLTYTKAQTLPEALDNLRNKCNWSDNDRYEYALDLRRDDITLIAKGHLDNGIGWVIFK